MMTRRSFVWQGLVTSTSMLLAGMTGISFSQFARATEDRRWQMPDEGAPHAATWMAFGASADLGASSATGGAGKPGASC